MIDARALARGFVLVAVALAGGCGAANATNGTAAGGHSSVAFGGQVPVTIYNDTAFTVCFVRMGPSTERRWGDDWLGSEETVPTGAERTFGVVGGASWNIRVEGCDGSVISQATGIALNGATRMPVSTLRPFATAQLEGKPPAVATGAPVPWAGRPMGPSSGGARPSSRNPSAPPIAPTDQYPTAPGLAPPVTY